MCVKVVYVFFDTICTIYVDMSTMHLNIHMYIYVWMYEMSEMYEMYVCMYVRTYVCMYVRMYVCI